MGYSEIEIDAISGRHPVRAFEAYWTLHANDTVIPPRSRINPAEIAGVLPWLMVLEVLRFHSTTEFRYRLAGTGCTDLFGIDYTGKMLGDNLTPEGAAIRRQEFARVLEEGRPIISATNLPIQAKDFIKVYRGVFPVTASGSGTDQIFVVIAPLATECAVRPPACA